MELHKLSMAKLTHLIVGQLIKSNIKDQEATDANTTTDTHIDKYVQKIITDIALYEKGLLQIKKNEETEELPRLDNVRDLCIGACNKQLDVFENTRNASKLVAYKALDIVANKYNGLAYLNYEAESNCIDNLVAEQTNTTYAPHITTLNMGEFVDHMQQTTEEFRLKFSKLSTDISSNEIFNMKSIRKATFKITTIISNIYCL